MKRKINYYQLATILEADQTSLKLLAVIGCATLDIMKIKDEETLQRAVSAVMDLDTQYENELKINFDNWRDLLALIDAKAVACGMDKDDVLKCMSEHDRAD